MEIFNVEYAEKHLEFLLTYLIRENKEIALSKDGKPMGKLVPYIEE